jgi:hypothetical protein
MPRDAQIFCSLVTAKSISQPQVSGYDTRKRTLSGHAQLLRETATPDRFPDLMAAAIERRHLARWAAEEQAVKIQ